MATPAEKNSVMQLNEYCARNRYAPPDWNELPRTGPPHSPHFTYEVKLLCGNQAFTRCGGAKSAKLAKNEAAKALMAQLVLLHPVASPPTIPPSSSSSNDSLSAELPPPRPKRKPACFHYKKILAAIKAQRVNGDGVEVIIPNFDSKKALDQVGVMMNFKARYETYKVDADSNSSNENAGDAVLRVCIVSFKETILKMWNEGQEIIRPEIFCQGQGQTVEEADADCAARALKYVRYMNDKADAELLVQA